MESSEDPMTLHAPAAALRLSNGAAPRDPDRLPPAIALPIIAALSLAGWYAVWKLVVLALRLLA
jgi:hypothetical protein